MFPLEWELVYRYSLLRYYHIIYSRLARAASDIARLKKQLEHQQQQQGQEESITSESPQSLPGGGGGRGLLHPAAEAFGSMLDNNTLSTDGNNVVTTVPGSQGVDSLVNSIVEVSLLEYASLLLSLSFIRPSYRHRIPREWVVSTT